MAGATGRRCRSMRRFLKSLWYSPVLIAVLVFVLGAPKKIPK
jgi:hypothetical protein